MFLQWTPNRIFFTFEETSCVMHVHTGYIHAVQGYPMYVHTVRPRAAHSHIVHAHAVHAHAVHAHAVHTCYMPFVAIIAKTVSHGLIAVCQFSY